MLHGSSTLVLHVSCATSKMWATYFLHNKKVFSFPFQINPLFFSDLQDPSLLYGPNFFFFSIVPYRNLQRRSLMEANSTPLLPSAALITRQAYSTHSGIKDTWRFLSSARGREMMRDSDHEDQIFTSVWGSFPAVEENTLHRERWILYVKFIYLCMYVNDKKTKKMEAPSLNLWKITEWKMPYTSCTKKAIPLKIDQVLPNVPQFAYR